MSIHFQADLGLFVLDTINSTYAMQVNYRNRLVHVYWGGSLPRPEDLPVGEQLQYYPFEEEEKKLRVNEEFVGWGGYFFDEPCLKVVFANGVRDLSLRYESHEITVDNKVETLQIILKDEVYPFQVRLKYQIYPDCDIIDRSCTLENQGSDPIRVENAQSAVWHLPRGRGYRLTHMAGKWAGEHQIERVPLTQAKVLLESRRGISGPDANPWFAIDEGGQATETCGRVWFGALQWSGNWKITVEVNRLDQTRVTGGINDFDFSWNLKPGGSFQTPVFSGGFTDNGFGQASRILHKYQIDHILPPAKAHELRKVIYNSWEVFWFDINVDQQMKLAERAAELGAEVFVVDDGWFGARDDDQAGLGDWNPSPKKFPNGLTPLIQKVNSLGLDFGLWVEPEMVNPDSDLYRAHPDWVLHFPTSQRTENRNQLVLNFAREDVREFAYGFLDRLLTDYNIKHLKWDMNRYLSEPGWPEAAIEDQQSVWVHYVLNLYDVFRRLQAKHPQVIFENCCSGGGRVDLGMVRYTDISSRSDDADPLDALKLHEGFTQAYAAKTSLGCIGTIPNGINNRTTPLSYRAHVNMLGAIQISINLFTCSNEEFQQLKNLVALYKEIRPIVQNGNLFRLVSPWQQPYMAASYVTHDRSQAVLFVLGQSMQFRKILPRIRLAGMDPDRLYTVEGYKPMSGKALMEVGIEVCLIGDFDSHVIRISG